MKLIDNILPKLSLILNVEQRLLSEMLVRIVLSICMLWKVLHVFLSDGHVEITEVVEIAFS